MCLSAILCFGCLLFVVFLCGSEIFDVVVFGLSVCRALLCLIFASFRGVFVVALDLL